MEVAEAEIRKLEASGVPIADIVKALAHSCTDLHLLPLPVTIRQQIGLPDVRVLDLKGVTECAFHTQHVYSGAEIRHTPEDFVFPEVQLKVHHVLDSTT